MRDRFLQLMSTVDGSHFRGTIMPARDNEGGVFDFHNPRLILRTPAQTVIGARSVINAPSGEQYIVAEHFGAEAHFRSWRLFKVEQVMTWQRKVSQTDNLTGLDKTYGMEDLGKVYASLDMNRRQFIDPGLKLPIEKLTVVTNAAVYENDTLDDKRVVRSNFQLGVYVLEIQD